MPTHGCVHGVHTKFLLTVKITIKSSQCVLMSLGHCQTTSSEKNGDSSWSPWQRSLNLTGFQTGQIRDVLNSSRALLPPALPAEPAAIHRLLPMDSYRAHSSSLFKPNLKSLKVFALPWHGHIPQVQLADHPIIPENAILGNTPIK